MLDVTSRVTDLVVGDLRDRHLIKADGCPDHLQTAGGEDLG